MFKRKIILKLGLEVIAIIIGISASFWLNEISVDKENETQRNRVLNNILIEVNDIEKYCDERFNLWNQDIDIYNLLLNKNLNFKKLKEIAISKSRVEYNLIYYRDFDPPMNRYKSIINTGDLKYIKSENIKESLTRLHNLNFTKVASTVEYEKNLKKQVINLFTDEYPELFVMGSNIEINFEKYIKSLHKAIQENDNIKSNLIVQMKYFKTRVSVLRLYILTLDELKHEIQKINL